MKLYLITNGLGKYYTIANDLTEAANKVEKYLNDADYGFFEKRKTERVDIIAQAADDLRFITNKYLVP